MVETLYDSSSIDDEVKLYKTSPVNFYNWLLAISGALLNLSSGWIWVTYVPITTQTSIYYELNSNYVIWLAITFFISTVLFSIPCSLVMRKIRTLNIILAIGMLQFIGNFLRMVSSIDGIHSSYQKNVLLFTGQIVSSLASPVMLLIPTMITASYFDQSSKMLANSIISIANAIGVLCANSIGPLVIDMPNGMIIYISLSNVPALIGLLLIAIVYYNQSKLTLIKISPMVKNSISDDLFILSRNKAYILLTFIFSLNIGLFSTMLSITDDLARSMNCSSKNAGIGASLLVIGGMANSMLISYIMQKYSHNKKIPIVFILQFLSSIAFNILFWAQFINVPQWFVIVCYTLIGIVSVPLLPILLEYIVQFSNPVDESFSTSIPWFLSQLLAILLGYALSFLADTFKSWIYSILLCNAIMFISLILVIYFENKCNQNRTKILS